MTWHLDDHVMTDWGRIAWGRAGAGPALVLAHGWPWSSYAWSRVIPNLARHFTCYWYDMPGFGRSDRALGRDTGLGGQTTVMGLMLDHWGLEAPSVWAHDFGGAITLRACLLDGRKFGRFLLMNVVAMRPWGSSFFDHVSRHVDAFLGLPSHIHAALVRAYVDSALAHPLPPDDAETLAAPWFDTEGQHAFYRQFAQADEALTAAFEPTLPQLARRTVSCAVIWGQDDPWIPIQRGAKLAQAVGVPLHPMPGLGHLPQLEDPAATLRHALPLLTRKA